MSQIVYKIRTARLSDIISHLNECNNSFIPPLSEKVVITDYAKKISERAITFEAWENKKLCGLIAAYFNEGKSGFITNVSVLSTHSRLGIASQLMDACTDYAAQHAFEEIQLEVSLDNEAAINFYKKKGFLKYATKKNLVLMNYSINKKVHE